MVFFYDAKGPCRHEKSGEIISIQLYFCHQRPVIECVIQGIPIDADANLDVMVIEGRPIESSAVFRLADAGIGMHSAMNSDGFPKNC